MEKTLNISDQDLQSSLQDFLEEKEKKPKQSIWNLTTFAGLALTFTAFSYIGHTIATEILGLTPLPFMNTAMNIAPIFGGALLAVSVLSMFTFNRARKLQEKEEEIRVQQTYDKLDEFLYQDSETKHRKKSYSSKSSKSFSLSPTQKMFKSRTDKYLAGVCGGIAKHLGISSTVIRIIFLAALFLGYGSFALIYIAMAIIMPKEPISKMDDFF